MPLPWIPTSPQVHDPLSDVHYPSPGVPDCGKLNALRVVPGRVFRLRRRVCTDRNLDDYL
jgi:hypothetical protein